MQITSVHIRNFKSIREMEIHGIENALILVGKNNTGKTSVLDASVRWPVLTRYGRTTLMKENRILRYPSP